VWTQQAYLKASNTDARDEFGTSVSISGDTIVVGAPLEDSNAFDVNGEQNNNDAEESGAVYVFVRNGTTWTQQAYLKASKSEAYDQFGYSVSISEDTIVVGAPEEDSNATGVNGDQGNSDAQGSGAAYVYVRVGTAWTQQAYLKASNTRPFYQFGSAVSISGDTIVVGSLRESSDATGVNGDQYTEASGAAYVFVRVETTWTQQAYLKASNTDMGDHFGSSVSISGDTIVVGADGEASLATGVNGDESDNTLPHLGAAYVFVRNTESWNQTAYLKSSYLNTEAEAAMFGVSCAIEKYIVVGGNNAAVAYGSTVVTTGTTGTTGTTATTGFTGIEYTNESYNLLT
jgi:hypothetical protein